MAAVQTIIYYRCLNPQTTDGQNSLSAVERPSCPFHPARLAFLRTLDFEHPFSASYEPLLCHVPSQAAINLIFSTPSLSKLRLTVTKGWARLFQALPQSTKDSLKSLDLRENDY